MSLSELLGQLIMLWFGRMLRIAGVTIPLFGAIHVLFIIFNDEFLSQHIILTLTLTSLFSFACCLLTLSKICVLRRKRHAQNKTIELLCDSDLKYENETDEVPHYKLSLQFQDIGNTLKNLCFKNTLEFCKFRPAYGMFLLTGLVFLFAFYAALTKIKEWSVKDDFYCVALELTFSMVMLISVVYFIANSGFYTAAKDYDLYTPFEQFVHVPMKIVVAKTVAVFLTSGGTYSCLIIFIASLMALCITTSNYIYHATKIEGVLKGLLPPIFPDAREALRTVLIVMTLMCGHVLIGMVVAAFFEAKSSILCIIEKNWHRNFVAIRFLLQDTVTESLEDLKTALDHKRAQPLTAKEVIAFNYISWPIWRTKTPFMLCRFETDEPLKNESSDKQANEQDEGGSSKQPEAAEPEQVKPVHHVDESSKAAKEIKIGLCEFLDKTAAQEKLKLLGEQSTSLSFLKEMRELIKKNRELQTATRQRKISTVGP